MSALTLSRRVAVAEGVSYLVLLFGAMPLKYLAGEPAAVRLVGSVHGVLFLAFIAALYRAAPEHAWPVRRVFRVFVAALVPGGTLRRRR